jgi:hypothetical protein
MIHQNKNKIPAFFLVFTLGFSFFSAIESAPVSNSLTVEVLFKKVSHQNPWLIREPIHKTSNAIRIQNNKLFTMTIPNEIPLYAELNRSGRANTKLKIERYDRSTGFALLTGDENYGMDLIRIQGVSSHKKCNLKRSEYIKLSFSDVPIKAFKLDPNLIKDNESFLFKKNILCGIIIGNYLIPSEYIEHFVQNTSNFRLAHPGFEFESNLNSSERSFYFPKKRKGIVVTRLYPGVGPNNQLLPGDAIYEINGVSLARFSDSEIGDRALDLILRDRSKIRNINSIVHLKFTRNGKEGRVSYSLRPFQDSEFLVPEIHPFGTPPYIITGGLFFTELTGAYLKEFGEDYRKNSEKKLLYILESFHSKSHPHRNRVVLLSRVLPDERNKGYLEFQDLILNSVNGKIVSNLRELKRILSTEQNEFISFEFSGQKTIVFKKDEIPLINQNILRSYKLKSLDNIGNMD